jgi:Fe-S cluster biogenesis protein NfuA
MFIQTENTPNPETVKFIPGCEVMVKGTAEFKKNDDLSNAPLAQRLLLVDGVEKVFFGRDFISITKDQAHHWPSLKTMLLAEIMQHFMAGAPVLLNEEQHDDNLSHSASDLDDEIVKQIKILLDTRVRPAVAQDGGDILFERFDEKEGVVYLHMKGACAGCPSSTATLKHGIENMLKHYIPEVSEVRSAS